MSAALLSKLTQGQFTIRLVESDEIATIGVGEATIPAIKMYNNLCGLNEKEFVQATGATFKLGIEFCRWGHLQEKYFHAFGGVGRQWEWLSFYQYWLKMHKLGKADPFEDYGIAAQMAQHNRFMPADPNQPSSPLSEIAYAYHFDAGLYAKHLRIASEARGVIRTQGKIVQVKQHADNGHIASLVLDDGQEIEGDLFIDCSGLRGLLIEQTLKTGFDDWSHWLPCDSAWAVPSQVLPSIPPYTRASAHTAGWQWRIPLQHRTGNGLVFASSFISDSDAQAQLLSNLDTEPCGDPRLIKFTTGKRKKSWNGNCVAIGLAGGFIEPLESTSLHLVQTAITRLVNLFPDKSFQQGNIDHFNKLTDFEMEKIRDFIIAHYCVTQRDDTEFWRYCKNMPLPDSLKEKLDIFSAYGRVDRAADELFREDSWVQVLLGQGLIPERYDPLVDIKHEAAIADFMAATKQVIGACVKKVPIHEHFIKTYFNAAKLYRPSGETAA